MKNAVAPFLLFLALGSAPAGAQSTGFNKTAGGPYDYDTLTNWVNDNVNGIWDSSLTLTGTQTVTFDGNVNLADGLSFLYTGGFNVTLRSDGTANRTVALGGDILVNTVNSGRTITIGSSAANQGVSLDLGGGNRTLDVRTARALTLANGISNGSLTLQGGGTTNFSATSATPVTLAGLTVKNALLNAGAFNDIAISGALTIDGAGGFNASGHRGGISVISMASNSGRNHTLTAGSLLRANNGVVLFNGTNLGAAAANNTSNITFTSSPAGQLVGGGGGAGTTTISILPWALGGTTASAADTFVTYDANGIRPLNTSTEFANSITSGTSSSNNVRLAAGSGTTTINDPTTINSLYLVGSDTTATTVAGTGTLTVTSGAVYLGAANTTTAISANLDFGSRQGVIGYGQGKNTTISGAISGSNGLVLYQSVSNVQIGTPGTGIGILGNSGNSTYTGDTYVLGRARVETAFLPSGSRTGDVYVHGYLELGGSRTINGLNGSGTVAKVFSSAGSLTFGDNNANGDFSGLLTADSGTLSVVKIGTGTQVLSGNNTYTGSTTIRGGAVDVKALADGGTASGIGQSSSAANNLIVSGGTLRYSGEATGTDRLFTIGAAGAGLDSSGTGAVDFTNTGTNVSSEAAARAGTRTSGSDLVTGVTNFADLAVGARVTGTGIPANTTVVAFNPAAGTITLSNNASSDSSANMTFVTNRNLLLSGTNTGRNTIRGVLANGTGTLSVTKSGAGTWVLAGANTYTGATVVNGGTLIIDGSLAGGSSVTIAGGRLGGSGSIGGATTIGDGGAIAPGNSPGTLTFENDLTLETGSSVLFEGGDLIDVGGQLSLGVDWTLALQSGFMDGGTVTLFDYVTLGGSPDLTPIFDLDDLGFTPTSSLTLMDTGSSIVLVGISVVPEPSAFLMFSLGLGAFCFLRRKRRN